VNVATAIAEYMKLKGYAALCSDNCACEIGDLYPCGGEGMLDCRMVYANHCQSCVKRYKDCPKQERKKVDYDILYSAENCWEA